MAKDYYNTLEVDRNADSDQLKKAYRDLAQKWHPDKNPDILEEAEEKFKEISEAYAVLSDPEQKKNYDMTGSPSGNPFATGFRTTGTPFDIFFSRDPFGEMRQSGPRPTRGHSIQIPLSISLVESLFGAHRSVDYSVTSACKECGARGGKEFELCEHCKGSGFETRQQPGMRIQTSCSQCSGQGQRIKTPCEVCEGRRIVQESKKITVVVPPNLKHDSTLRIPGKGGEGFYGGPPGDVMIVVKVEYPDLSGLTEEERGQLEALLEK